MVLLLPLSSSRRDCEEEEAVAVAVAVVVMGCGPVEDGNDEGAWCSCCWCCWPTPDMLLWLMAAATEDAQALCCCPAIVAARVVVGARAIDKAEAAAGVAAREALPAALAQARDEENDETPRPPLRPCVTTLWISPAAVRDVDVAMACDVVRGEVV